MTLKNRLKRLRNKDFQVGSENTILELYPCSCCGDPMFIIADRNTLNPIVNVDISTTEGLKIVTAVYNQREIPPHETPMKPSDFLMMIEILLEKKEEHDLEVSE
jgi:hypothetical protein